MFPKSLSSFFILIPGKYEIIEMRIIYFLTLYLMKNVYEYNFKFSTGCILNQ